MSDFNVVLTEGMGVQPEIFQGRGGFGKLGHLDKHFVKNSIKKNPRSENFVRVFSPRYS